MAPRNRSRSVNRRQPQQRHKPLEDDLLATGILRTKSRKRKSSHDDEEADDDAGAQDSFVEAKASRKILRIGRDLQKEEEDESKANAPNPAFSIESRISLTHDDDDDSDPDGEDERFISARIYDDEDAWNNEGEEALDEQEVDPLDLDLFNRLNPSAEDNGVVALNKLGDGNTNGSGSGVNLADLILEKIAAHEANRGDQPHAEPASLDMPDDEPQPLPPKVIEVYSKIGLLLTRYKSGPLPKPFKILPRLPAWQLEPLLSLTQPDTWTPQACYAATRIFVSAPPATVQSFLTDVLLARVRTDIHDTRKLNVHLFAALRKALYKPAAFFKGFLFPLVDPQHESAGGGEGCTLREAHIISAVLARNRLPVLHSAAALLRLTDIAADMHTTTLTRTTGLDGNNLGPFGAVNTFILTLLKKKYALPYKVLDALVFYFLRFRHDGAGEDGKAAPLPVLWHHTLLAFAQRYRTEITEDQREALLDLLITRGHKDIGAEVRRELLLGRAAAAAGQTADDGKIDGDDTMIL